MQEQPNVSQATTAKKLRIVPVPRLETQAANPVATTAAPPSVEATSLNEATLPPIAPAIETNWAPPDVDEERDSTDSRANCRLKEAAEAAGGRVQELVKNVDQFTATEDMEHESLSPLGVQKVVTIGKTNRTNENFKLWNGMGVRIIRGIEAAGPGSRIQRQRSRHTYEVHGTEV